VPPEVLLIGISIDGSVTVIEDLHPRLGASLRWLEDNLSRPGSPLFVPGTPPIYRFHSCWIVGFVLIGRTLFESEC